MKKKVLYAMSLALLLAGFGVATNETHTVHAMDIICDNCGGTGWVKEPCDACYGTRKVTCDECWGTGGTTCDMCWGSGEIFIAEGVYDTCITCDGTGIINCYRCDGTKMMECMSCLGTGIMDQPCDFCCGEGIIHEHDYETEFTYDDHSHWREATCGHPYATADYGSHDTNGENGSCSICGRPAPHTHGDWQYSLTPDGRGITAMCGKSPCPDGATVTLLIKCDKKEFEYTGNPVEASFDENEKSDWESKLGSAPELMLQPLGSSQLTDGKAVNPGAYKVSFSAGGLTASHEFEIAPHAHGNWSISTDTNNYAIVLTCNRGGCEDPAHTERLSLGGNEKEFEYTGNPIELSLNSDGVTFWQNEFERVPEIVYGAKSGSSLTNNKPVNIGSYTATISEESYSVTFEFDIVAPKHTHSGVKQNGQAATEETAGFKDYYKCSCDKLFEESTCTTEITDLAVWKAEGGNGFIAKLAHTHKNPTKHDAVEPQNEGEYGVKEYYECSCGKFFEDANCSKEIGDATALASWKNNAGKGSYFAPLPDEAPDGLSGGAIAAITIGSTLGALLIAYIVMFAIWKKSGIGISFLIPSFEAIDKVFFKKTNKNAENK